MSFRGLLVRVSALFALAYATLAGFHTLSDFDVWWQLASGRWMWDHAAILRTETFSYTAAGAPWTYPALGEVFFYWIWRFAGLSGLSLLTPLACLVIAAVLLRKADIWRAWLVVAAAPLIAWRANLRADMFTTLLATVFLAVLWENHRRAQESRRWLWPLAALMALWANLHPGFFLGLALLALFTLRHPRRVAPVAAIGALATLANPFGWRVYSWLGTLATLLPLPESAQTWLGKASHPASSAFIGEFSRTPVSLVRAGEFFRWRDPDSALWWVLALAAAAIFAGLLRGEFWGALLIAGSAVAAVEASRFQAVFAIAVAVVAPDLLGAIQAKSASRFGGASEAASKNMKAIRASLGDTLTPIFALLLMALAGVRIADLASNRYYLMHGDIASFGTGVSGWFPDRAAKFIQDQHLPRELYNDYNSGGYLTWRLSPDYPVFIDGRGDPYGTDLFFLVERLRVEGPASAAWRAAVTKWNIHTLVMSVSRFAGYSGFPIQAFCAAQATGGNGASGPYHLAYLDETAAVFTDAPSAPRLDCKTAPLAVPPPTASMWDRYQFYANAGKLYYAFERDAEADQAWKQADEIFDGDPALHLDIAQLRHVQGRMPDAEHEFRRSIELRPTSVAWYGLGDLLSLEGRAPEAMECFRQSAGRTGRPHEAWAALARSALAAQLPLQALDAANRALETSPYKGPAAAQGRAFTARSLAIRGAAQLALGEAPAGVASLEEAVRTAGDDPRLAVGLRLALADGYRQAGRMADARRALDDAKQLGAKGPQVDDLKKELAGKP